MKNTDFKNYQSQLLKALDLELQTQTEQVKKAYQSIGELKRSGYGIYPIHITNQTFGFGEYPEISFKVPLNQSIDKFRNQEQIELFSDEGVVRGALLFLNTTQGKLRIFADDFPEWINGKNVGIRVGVDEKTILLAKEAMQELTEDHPFISHLFSDKKLIDNDTNFSFQTSTSLNESQNQAVNEILSPKKVTIIHGPPGTGKTTTLVEAIRQMTLQGEKVLAMAPSNMAVDHLSLSLIKAGVKVLRIGNPSKISEELTRHTIDGKLMDGAIFQEIKKMKIRAEEFRKMASQYKRKFGREEAEQRKMIWNEYRSIKKEIRQTIDFYKDKWQEEAQVICGTPIGLASEMQNNTYTTLVIDEAGQCLQPLAWFAIKKTVQKLVLAGDPYQLPPTVLSDEAIQSGLNSSILDLFLTKSEASLLDTQYRMREAIAGFSNLYFYDGKLKSVKKDTAIPSILFYDTAGTGYEEEREQEGSSYFNQGELELVPKIIEQLVLEKEKTAFISPYSGQVSKAREMDFSIDRITSIDSFQGQENEVIILSLVRSNEMQEIGFLRDYRRMNVALTRAQELLIVIGDSGTFGNDTFYQQFLDYIEQNNAYRTAWELM